MFKTIKYISALSVVGFSLAACSDDITNKSDEYTISGTGEKSPLEIAVSLKDGYNRPSTRAVDTKFKTGDVLIAYVQQVKGTLSSGNPPVFIPDATKPVVISTKVEFTVKDADNGVEKVTSDYHSTNIYWDDFSSTADDIRDADRYLRVGYGYCYNGRTDGYTVSDDGSTVKWTVDADQKTNGIKTSDLLWAGAQEVRHYNHDSFKPNASDAEKQSVILPVVYEHAMSKVTLELVLADGYGNITTDQINAIAPKLFANKTAVYNAVAKTVTPTVETSPGVEISMSSVGSKTESGKTYYIYEALIAPTAMVDGKKLAEVTVAGNKYELNLTTAMLGSTDEGNKNAWGTQLESNGTSHPGVNYHLVATLKKQRIEVEAMILPWNEVYAATTGTISFNADVVTSEVNGATEVAAGSFDLWRSVANNSDADYDNVTSSTGEIDRASTYTNINGKWVGDPAIYWENGTTKHYFRALAKATAYETDSNGKPTTVTEIESVGGSTAVAQTYDAENNRATSVDLLWAQTSEHKAKDANENYLTDNNGNDKVYEAGAAIDPRSGAVPLTFQHAMSKISIQLATTEGADAVTGLENATISIINLYDRGTISVKDGTVINSSLSKSSAEPMTIKDILAAQIKDFLVVPQSLVKLNDGSARNLTPTFYSSEELTGIYSDGTTHEPSTSATPTYYLTSQLNRVDAVLYSEAEILAHNANLKDADNNVISVSTESVKIQAEYYDDIQKYNDDKIFRKTDVLTETIFSGLLTNDESNSLEEKVWVKEYILYGNTLQDLKDFVANLDDISFNNIDDDNFKQKEVNVSYTLSEFKTLVAGLDTPSSGDMLTRWSQLDNKYKKKSAVLYSYDDLQNLEEITSAMWAVLPPEAKIKVREEKYTADEAKEYNSKLPGAWHEGEVKTPAYYKLPNNETPSDTTLPSYAPGSLKNAGNKIMLYVYLEDGTRYSADLSTCLVANEAYISEPNAANVTTWEGNHHYNYKITLTKAKIELRALIKDWVEYKVSGNATLDWD